MQIVKKVSIITLIASFVFGLSGASPVVAATTPDLLLANTFGVLAGTYTNTVAGTTITGDVGYATGPAVVPTINGTNHGAGGSTPQARTDAAAALTTLAANSCTETLGVIVDLSTVGSHPTGVYTPGVYCSTGAMSIGTGGITLSGAGTYIFRAVGALTSVANSVVTLANGASSCDVFWTPTAATTLGANTTFVGTIIDNANAITVGANTTLTGRALSLGAGTVTTDTDTINRTCVTAAATAVSSPSNNTITVVKQVINDSGGTATYSDFPLFVNGNPVTSGQSIAFAPGTYTVTETTRPGYTRTFTGDCNASGQINHGGFNTKNNLCTVVNDDIGAPPIAPVPPLIEVVKVPTPLALPAGPGPVAYAYTVRNIGTVPMTNVTLVGDTCSPIVLASGDANADSKLDVNETWVYSCSKTLTETTRNTVTATGYANGLTAIDVASATVVVGVPVVPPLIHVTKVPNPLTLPAGAGMVTYTKKVTNPGAVALSNVSVTDDKCSPVTYVSGDTNSDQKLDTNETWTYTCSTNLTKTTTNTAIATGSANGLTATDFALATVVVAVPKLPSTGLPPEGKSIPWNIAIPAGMFAVSILFYVARRKQTA